MKKEPLFNSNEQWTEEGRKFRRDFESLVSDFLECTNKKYKGVEMQSICNSVINLKIVMANLKR